MKIMHPEVKQHLGTDCRIPAEMSDIPYGANNAFYIASCLQNSALFVSDAFRTLTGFSPKVLSGHGMERLMSLIHPEDAELVMQRIITKCVMEPEQKLVEGIHYPAPFALEYRMKHASGNWIWIRETKCIISRDSKGNKDKIIGVFEDINMEKRAETEHLLEGLRRDHTSFGILKAWEKMMQMRQEQHDRQGLVGIARTTAPDQPILTKREKEVLELIGQGFSTKQLADQLHISINTVETHRRHLIDKFQVRNSAELITKASRILL